MNDRTPEQTNNALDRAEAILADLSIRLDRLEENIERLEAATQENTTHIADLVGAIDRTNLTVENLANQVTRQGEGIDRLAGVLERFITQSALEKTYQRGVISDLADRITILESPA